MPEKRTLARAQTDKRQGKAPSTQAGEFIKEEIHNIRQGAHGARSAKQAIAIGLSMARRAGVDLPPPRAGKVSDKKRRQAARDVATGREPTKSVSKKRSQATLQALKRESTDAASPRALSRQARAAAGARAPADRPAASQRASRTKGRAQQSAAALLAARTRAGHSAA